MTEDILCLFVAHLSHSNLQHSTDSTAVCHLQISAALPDPTIATFPHLTYKYVLKGLHRATKPSNHHWLPITPDILNLLVRSWSQAPIPYEVRLLWAACTVSFLFFSRAGEFTSCSPSIPDEDIIAVTDVARDPNYPPSFVRIHLQWSKTDPFSTGVDIYLGCTGHSICPVAALLAFLAVRPADPKGPLFRFHNGSTLSRDWLVREVGSVLQHHSLDITVTVLGLMLPLRQQRRVGSTVDASQVLTLVLFEDLFSRLLGICLLLKSCQQPLQTKLILLL